MSEKKARACQSCRLRRKACVRPENDASIDCFGCREKGIVCSTNTEPFRRNRTGKRIEEAKAAFGSREDAQNPQSSSSTALVYASDDLATVTLVNMLGSYLVAEYVNKEPSATFFVGFPLPVVDFRRFRERFNLVNQQIELLSSDDQELCDVIMALSAWKSSHPAITGRALPSSENEWPLYGGSRWEKCLTLMERATRLCDQKGIWRRTTRDAACLLVLLYQLVSAGSFANEHARPYLSMALNICKQWHSKAGHDDLLDGAFWVALSFDCIRACENCETMSINSMEEVEDLLGWYMMKESPSKPHAQKTLTELMSAKNADPWKFTTPTWGKLLGIAQAFSHYQIATEVRRVQTNSLSVLEGFCAQLEPVRATLQKLSDQARQISADFQHIFGLAYFRCIVVYFSILTLAEKQFSTVQATPFQEVGQQQYDQSQFARLELLRQSFLQQMAVFTDFQMSLPATLDCVTTGVGSLFSLHKFQQLCVTVASAPIDSAFTSLDKQKVLELLLRCYKRISWTFPDCATMIALLQQSIDSLILSPPTESTMSSFSATPPFKDEWPLLDIPTTMSNAPDLTPPNWNYDTLDLDSILRSTVSP